jgi:hypothetical protein
VSARITVPCLEGSGKGVRKHGKKIEMSLSYVLFCQSLSPGEEHDRRNMRDSGMSCDTSTRALSELGGETQVHVTRARIRPGHDTRMPVSLFTCTVAARRRSSGFRVVAKDQPTVKGQNPSLLAQVCRIFFTVARITVPCLEGLISCRIRGTCSVGPSRLQRVVAAARKARVRTRSLPSCDGRLGWTRQHSQSQVPACDQSNFSR